MNIKRPLTEEEFELAFKQLEIEIKNITQKHSEYFKDGKNPKSISYIQAPGQKDLTGLTVYNVPFIAFTETGLSEEIKQEVRQAFIDLLLTLQILATCQCNYCH